MRMWTILFSKYSVDIQVWNETLTSIFKVIHSIKSSMQKSFNLISKSTK